MKKTTIFVILGVLLSIGLVFLLLELRMPFLQIVQAFLGLLIISAVGIYPRFKGVADSGLCNSDLKSIGNALYVSGTLLFLVNLIAMMRDLESPDLIGEAMAAGALPVCLAAILVRLVLEPWRFRLTAVTPAGNRLVPGAARVRLKLRPFAAVMISLLILLAVLWLFIKWPLRAFLSFFEYRSLLLALLLPGYLVVAASGPTGVRQVIQLMQPGSKSAITEAQRNFAKQWSVFLNGSFLTVALVGGSLGLLELVGNINDLQMVGPALHFALDSMVYALIAYIVIGLRLSLTLARIVVKQPDSDLSEG